MKALAGDLENPQAADSHLIWRDVRFEVPGKVILDKVWGSAAFGSVTVIMGPSGSGKTTLLDYLAQRIDGNKKGRSLTGSVTINGVPVDRGRPRVAYVQQEDALVGVLSVIETLHVAAAFAGVPMSRADELLREFGLVSARDTMIGTIFQKGISGGQKRRLSIAIELISRPRIVLLDEPTSGLDSAAALAVVDRLKKIATASSECTGCSRVAIAATLHQPNNAVWNLVDNVCFLAGGKLVYSGSTGDALLAFFRDGCGHPVPQYASVADFVLSLINEDFPGHADVQDIVRAFAASASQPPADDGACGKEVKYNGLNTQHILRASRISRFLTLTVRGSKELRRDVGIIMVRLAMSILIALMYLNLGRGKSDSDISARVSVLFYVAAFMVFMVCCDEDMYAATLSDISLQSVAVVPFFVIQRAVFIKERTNGAYDVPEYVLSKFITSVPGVLLLAIVSSVIIVFSAKLNGFPIYFLDLFLSLLVAESFMAFIAAAVPHYIIGIALAAGLFGFNMLCEGFFRVKHDIPKYLIWGYHLGFHTYSFRVFMWNEFHVIHRFNSKSQFKDGDAVLRFYDMSGVTVWADLVILICWIVFFQAAFAFVLTFFHTGRR